MTLPLPTGDANAKPVRMRTAHDRHHAVPVHVVWEITLACNLKCGHCGSRAGKRRANELSTAECLDVVHQLAEAGTREVTLIGGEAYLRRDWLEIAAEIARLGMHCGVQTGARGLTKERIQAAYDAGVRAIGVSVDGLRELHDSLRGVSGSHDQAIQAVRWIGEVGIEPGVNTQINARSAPQLRQIFDEIVSAGAKYWQVQLTVAMGNAVDNSEILLQPHQIIDVVDCLAELYHKGRDVGFRLVPGNSIGYFGQHEAYRRSLTGEISHWDGCTAGETALGLEADGTIKGCPSLPKSITRTAKRAPPPSRMPSPVSPTAPCGATAIAAAVFAAPAILEFLPGRLHLGVPRAGRAPWRQSLLPLSRHHAGAPRPTRNHHQGGRRARRAVCGRPLQARPRIPRRLGGAAVARRATTNRAGAIDACAVPVVQRIHLPVRDRLPALRRLEPGRTPRRGKDRDR